MSRQTLIKIGLIFLASLVISFVLQRFFHVGLTEIQAFVVATGVWAPLVYSLILFLGLVVPFNPISDSITVSIAALVFPPAVAIAMTFFAHTLALTVNYTVSRAWGDDLLTRILSKHEVDKIQKFGPKIKPWWIFGFRFLLPLNAIGFDFISYAAGISKMDFKKFFVASIIPWTILNVLFFSSAGYLRNINPGLIFVPFIFLVLAPVAYFSLSRKQSFREKIVSFLKRK